MDPRVFTRRSSVAALVTGVLVAVALGRLFGAPWGLAAITGFPAATAVLAVSFGVRNGLYRTRPRPWGPAPWTGAFLLGQTVVFVPATFSGQFLDLNWATQATFQLLFLLAGFAALMFGYGLPVLVVWVSTEAERDSGAGGPPRPRGARGQSRA